MHCDKHNTDHHSFCLGCAMEKKPDTTTKPTWKGWDSFPYNKENKVIFVEPLKKDMVNSPSHYTQGGIETIDYIKAKLTPEEFKGYLKGNIIKYTSRAGLKDEVAQEFKKAQWYIQRMINELDSN